MKTSRESGAGNATWSWRRFVVLTLTMLLAFGAALQARAQSAPAGDPPSRAARLSDVSGQVWLYSEDSDEWLGVERNRPLTTGDRIATDNGARAEITLGTTTLRLDAATELEIVRLDDSRYAVRLNNGSVAARLRSAQSLAEFELTTEEGRFRVQAIGRYRFDRLDQTSDLTVFTGQAVFEGRNSALPVYTGQHAQFWLDAGGVPQYAMVATARDAFAAWNDERDRSEERVATHRYVSPEMTGAGDLERYGQWQQTPDYGPIWVPTTVPSGWAPYSAGHWAWVRPWGWTWVDDAPWGFAPFHYGRWVYHRDVWCWAPGTYAARPVYAPALVAWVGGPRVGVSITVGRGGPPVGWFPLAPREVYVPSYRASQRYVRDVNFAHASGPNVTLIFNNKNGEVDRRDFANRRFPNAVTFVPSEVITARQPVGPAAARFRGDPRMRELVAGAQPAPALIAPPIASPPAPTRSPQGRQAARPPFEGRSPGNFAGRPEGVRPDAGRPDAGRPEAGRADVGRPEAGRPEAGRSEGGRPDGGRQNRSETGRADPGRPEFGRPGERPGAGAAPVRPGTPAATAGVAPVTPPAAVQPAPVAQPPAGFSGRRGSETPNGTQAPAVARDPAAPATSLPAPQRPAPDAAVVGQRPAIAPPAQRSNPPNMRPGGGDAVRPGFAPLGGRGGGDAAGADNRAAPATASPPAPIANPAQPDGATGRRMDRVTQPRPIEPVRPAMEPVRPIVEPVRPAPTVRAPEPVAPAAAQRAPDPRPAEVQRAPGGEPRMSRPEGSRERDQRREDRQREPQR